MNFEEYACQPPDSLPGQPVAIHEAAHPYGPFCVGQLCGNWPAGWQHTAHGIPNFQGGLEIDRPLQLDQVSPEKHKILFRPRTGGARISRYLADALVFRVFP